MYSIETLTWIFGGALTVIGTLIGVVWKILRDEAKDHADQIRKKADQDRLHEVESRWEAELIRVKDSGEKLVNKLEQRHEREIEQLSTRITEQMRSMESNILGQMQMMLKFLNNGKE